MDLIREQRHTEDLLPYINNPKSHPDAQVNKIAASISEFGFIWPILIDKNNGVIAGHGRLLAAQKLGLREVPIMRVEHLTEGQIKAFRLADNRAAESPWDEEMLKVELEQMNELDLDLKLTMFDEDEIERILAEKKEKKDLSEDLNASFEIVIECKDEHEQQEIYTKLTEEGYTCRVLTL